MSYNTSQQIVEIVSEVAQSKSSTSTPKTLLLAFMAGSYIAIGGLLALIIGGGVPGIAAANPGIQRFLMGAAFPIGLMLCAIAGADLFTGNTAYFIPPLMSGKISATSMLRNWSLVYLGNFAGALFVAYVLTYLTGVLSNSPWIDTVYKIAESKTSAPFYKVFLKGIGANWLVALAMWLAYAAKDVTGKILGIWVPVMAFVTIGFEHSIANMFFVPVAIFHGAPVSWADFVFHNLVPATLGNIAGGSVLVGLFYWLAYKD
ncbi:MAG: formate transporter [Bacteroidetes bacterium]|nr:formate transporter [Bacteroidota bacterium]